MRRFGIAGIVVSVCIVLLAAGLLIRADAVTYGVRAGLAAGAGTLIPSLFPFMALCGFLARTDYGAVLARPLRLVWRWIFRIPDEAGAVALLSLVGGYPVGAKGIASLLERGVIDRPMAERMLCFCVNCGPSFLITAVGAGLMLDRTAGVILFASQTLATLLIGAAASLGSPLPSAGRGNKPAGRAGEAFIGAVSGASSAMIVICAFAALFSGLLALLDSTGLPFLLAARLRVSPRLLSALAAGFLEVTSGCFSAAGIGERTGFLLTSLFVSFGGLSVIFQIMSCFGEEKISFGRFILSRIVHMPLAAAIALPLWKRFCFATSVSSAGVPVAANPGARAWLGALCLIGMSTILLFSAKPLKEQTRRCKIVTNISKKGRFLHGN